MVPLRVRDLGMILLLGMVLTIGNSVAMCGDAIAGGSKTKGRGDELMLELDHVFVWVEPTFPGQAAIEGKGLTLTDPIDTPGQARGPFCYIFIRS